MSRRKPWVYGLCGLAALVVAGITWHAFSGVVEEITDPRPVDRPPVISPDYAGVVIPPNICALNFLVKEPGTKYRVRISAPQGEAIEVFSRSPGIVIPPGPWKELLEANRGAKLTFDVCVKARNGTWRRFQPVVNTIASEEIDNYLVYREMPVFNLTWSNMGLYQRGLRGYDASLLLHNRSYDYGCMNCHTFIRNRPETMALNVRASPWSKPLRAGTLIANKPIRGGMLIVRDGVVTNVVNTKTAFNPVPAIYLAWHPSGKAIAFSTNKINQTFHAVGENRHSVDSFSDMGLYLIDSNTVTTTPPIARPDRLETHPAWSPDGSYLYFCSARPTVPQKKRERMESRRKQEIEEGKRKGPVWTERHQPYFHINRYKDLHYDLVRIRYDIETDTWGEKVETVLTTDETRPSLYRPEIHPEKRNIQRSIAQPQFSPDGRFVLLCIAAFGNFPVYQETSDLYLLDFQTKRCLPLNAVNSDRSESWHSWSSNGRWIVFSSKRPAGLLARPHFSYIDGNGNACKPFVLPQKDPAFYESCYRTFNRPELVAERINLTPRDLLRALRSPNKQKQAHLAPDVKPTDTVTGAIRKPMP